MQVNNKVSSVCYTSYQSNAIIKADVEFGQAEGFASLPREKRDATKYPIGARSYTEEEWDEFLERFDATQEVIRELMRERHKRQEEQREEQERLDEKIEKTLMEKKILEKELLEKERLEQEELRKKLDKLFIG